ncbi:MAG TPA: SDR family NAD(P)-dependent oxidoreductase [Micavibrio sp.]
MAGKIFKTILITGASSGIGEALAFYYAGDGVRLLLTGRDPERLLAVAARCHAQGAQVETTLIDVCDREELAAWIAGQDQRAPIDLVIANAGISGGTGGAVGTQWLESEYKIFDVNLQGVLNTILPLVPLMQARGAGQIAIMSSLAGFSGWPGAPAYSASKAAVRIYGEALRGALARYGVGVSVICPGFVESRMTAVNDYKMPFFMPAPRAAAIIARGLAFNRARIAFPWQTFAISGFIGLLPPALSAYLLAKLPPKPALPVTQYAP